MYKTYEEWKGLGWFVRLGQRSYLKREDGTPLFYMNQVQQSVDHHEVFMMQLEAECTDPNG